MSLSPNKWDLPPGPLSALIRFTLERKVVVFVVLALFILWGVMVAPFDWNISGLSRNPVAVDAIPDIGENQQVVFTRWPGRSPKDVDDQVTYPLTVALLGLPGVKTIRSQSMFGFSSIYVIFKEEIPFYWSRSRILEKLASLPPGTLPPGVQPALGPDATALGQVYWYTLEGRTPEGKPAGGWDLQELRTIQDWYVRYALMAVDGVAEVASIGGFVKEYQIDIDPDALRRYGVTIAQVANAVRKSNKEVGAKTMEINGVEYLVRGIGFVRKLSDLEQAVVAVRNQVPIRVSDVAHVTLGPALRRGILDKEGTEAVGGVVIVRYGANPLAVIKRVKAKLKEIEPSLPQRKLRDGTVSKVTVVPFYDRTGLIHETLGTLETALTEEILVTVIVIVVMLLHLGSSVLISGLLPMAVLMTFILMKLFGVDANLVALSGIAIAIGTMVDMGIVLMENIFHKLEDAPEGADRTAVVAHATREVGGAVMTAVATTVVSFLPVFAMQGSEGKLFKPLAYTKTFALIASLVLSLLAIPPLADMLFSRKVRSKFLAHLGNILLGLLAGLVAFKVTLPLGLALGLVAVARVARPFLSKRWNKVLHIGSNLAVGIAITMLLADHWLPLGPEPGLAVNTGFVGLVIATLLGGFVLFAKIYPKLLGWTLRHRVAFLVLVGLVIGWGGLTWLGFKSLPKSEKLGKTRAGAWLASRFPGLQKEFMPPLDEGSYLYMPTTMPHASVTSAHEIIREQDMAISSVPEVSSVVGKLGRAETAIDPAPMSMIETIINYHPKFLTDKKGRRLRFRYDADKVDLFRNQEGKPVPAPDGKPYKVRGTYLRDDQGRLVADPDGQPFRLWRPALDPKLNPGRKAWKGIQRPDDIWRQITKVAKVPGSTSAPRLQPIKTRIVMLQSGMRASMGLKIKGPTLAALEKTALQIEKILKTVPSIAPASVVADRVVGKPYLEVHVDRAEAARYGLNAGDINKLIEFAVGGMKVTTTVEGRERYPVRIRFQRERRDSIEAIRKLQLDTPTGAKIPLDLVAKIKYVRGPQAIKSEDTFLVAYVTFGKKNPEVGELKVVEDAKAALEKARADGILKLPAGVSYAFAGSYKNQVEAERRLAVVLPVALAVIFLILYLQLRSVVTTLEVFSGVFVAWSGGFIILWLYGRPWFMDFSLFGTSMRSLFQIHPVNLSVAVWVGFLALFGIATDNGVVLTTFLKERFDKEPPSSPEQIRRVTVEVATSRIRPLLMTTATTILALLPVLTSAGRGSDLMIPMALPSFGGMLVQLVTLMTVPVLLSISYEWTLRAKLAISGSGPRRPPTGGPDQDPDQDPSQQPGQDPSQDPGQDPSQEPGQDADIGPDDGSGAHDVPGAHQGPDAAVEADVEKDENSPTEEDAGPESDQSAGSDQSVGMDGKDKTAPSQGPDGPKA